MNAKHVVVVAAAITAVGGMVGIRARRSAERANAPRLAPTALSVEVAVARKGTVESRQPYVALVVAREEAALSARIVSQVLQIDVREGDHVARGQVLVKLDRRELDDARTSTEAAVAASRESEVAAQILYETQRQSTARDRTLAEADAIARDEWERSQATEAAAHARLVAARAQSVAAARALASAQTRREYAVLRAPFDGIISARHVDAGDLAAPGKPLVSIVRGGGVRVRAGIPAERAVELRPTTAAVVHAAGEAVRLRIARVFPAADPSRLATIEIDIPDRLRLLPGSTLSIDLVDESEPALIVPATAVADDGRGLRVFVDNGGRFCPVPVTILARGDDAVAVRGDLAEGARVAVGTPARLAMLAAGALDAAAGDR